MSLDAMKQALEALNDCTYDEEGYCLNPDNVDAILALRAAIEQAEKPRQWQGLTDEDVDEVERWVDFKEEGSGRIPTQKLVRYIERKLKERNT